MNPTLRSQSVIASPEGAKQSMTRMLDCFAALVRGSQ
jgi:hypothetical protein